MIDSISAEEHSLISGIRQIIQGARIQSVRAVNSAMVDAYWQIGRLIVTAQGGNERAAYGDNMLQRISAILTVELGKGFTTTNLRYMRQFYLTFQNYHTLCDNLSWSHIRLLLKVKNKKAQEFYAEEASRGNWSVRQLERQIYTQSYERLLSTQRADAGVENNIKRNLPAKAEKFDPLRLVHDPFVLEFLDLPENSAIQENDLEDAILTHIEDFLLELGRGFAFVGRQKRFTLDGDHFYPDLVFYNIRARCYVIIDLKMGKASYQDVGQMQLYVSYFNKEVCEDGDNPTVGIILCAEKNDTVIEYTLGDRTDIGIFASKYKCFIPTEEELRREIEQTRESFRLLNNTKDDRI